MDDEDEYIYPKIKNNCEAKVFIAIKLSKAGYGTIEEIMDMRADLVLAALEYELFLHDYEKEFIALNKKD
jgi:hypothetical protein